MRNLAILAGFLPSFVHIRVFSATIVSFTLRRAITSDAAAIANVYSVSFRLLAFLLMLHSMTSGSLLVYC